MLKTPKLRFKDKNGNAYPEWEEKRIEEILKIKHGKDQKTIVLDNGIYPILATSGEIGRTNTYLWNKPSVLIGRKGTINKPQYMDTPFWTVDTLFYSDVFSNNNAKYIYYLFNTINWKKYDESTGVPSLSAKTIERIKVVISKNLCEQEKIAGFLSKVDEFINECEGEVKDLEEQKKGLMQKIFSQQIRFKDSNNNPYPDWEEKKLYDITDVRDGTHDSPKYVAYGYPLITSKNLTKDGKLDFSDVSYITEQDYKEINKRSKVHVGDILFGMIGTIGKPVVIQEDNFAIKNVALIKNNQNNINRYLVHYLQSDNILRQFHVEIAGGTQKFIALGLIRNLKIQIPCKEEQEKIAKVLSKMDELIEEKKALLSDWQQFKKGLLQQMFV